MALSSTCQSSAARGFNPASAESHATSRSLIRVLAAGRSPLFTMEATSAAMLRNADRSPNLDAVFARGSEVSCAVAAGAAEAVPESTDLEHPGARVIKAMTDTAAMWRIGEGSEFMSFSVECRK